MTAGTVQVGGLDVRDRDIEELWSTIGLVPQRGYLFSGTVADNLRYGKPDATDDEMWEALRVAAADEFVRAHADGLQMRVAQGGINFSGGQRQRLAIARAVIRRPAIYVFDDAFSALDVHTDALVRTRLAEVAADATVIVVAQRISTIVDADQVIVVEDGRVAGIRHARVAVGGVADLPGVRRIAVAGRRGGRSTMTTQAKRQVAAPPAMRPRDFRGSTVRLVKLLAPQRHTAVAVMALSVLGTVDRRRRPADSRPRHRPAVQRRDRPEAARGHHQGSGRRRGTGPRRQRLRRLAIGNACGARPRRGLRRGRPHARAGAGHVSGCRADDLRAGSAAQRDGATVAASAASASRRQAAPAAAGLLRHSADGAKCSAGSPTTSTTCRRRCR